MKVIGILKSNRGQHMMQQAATKRVIQRNTRCRTEQQSCDVKKATALVGRVRENNIVIT